MHKNFRKIIKLKEEYTNFIQILERDGKKAIDSVVSKYGSNRKDCLNGLVDLFSLHLNTQISAFHAQVIMRAIKMCMHIPFGEVDHVDGGKGSKSIADVLTLD